jgi:hypothetical protein
MILEACGDAKHGISSARFDPGAKSSHRDALFPTAGQ